MAQEVAGALLDETAGPLLLLQARRRRMGDDRAGRLARKRQSVLDVARPAVEHRQDVERPGGLRMGRAKRGLIDGGGALEQRRGFAQPPLDAIHPETAWTFNILAMFYG